MTRHGKAPEGKDYRLVTCVMPAGQGTRVLDLLRREHGVISASIHHARGVGTRSMHRRALYYAEKQVIMALVHGDDADTVFEFLYHEAGLHERHAGMIFMERLARGSPLVPPEGEWEED